MPADDSAESSSGDQRQRGGPEEAGLANTDRLVALTDGVVAIALTLLVLQLTVPHLPVGQENSASLLKKDLFSEGD